jgi:hypothetical protein
MGGSSVVESAAELVEALQSNVEEIEVRGTLSGMPMITLVAAWLGLHNVDDRVASVEVEAGGGEERCADVSGEE